MKYVKRKLPYIMYFMCAIFCFFMFYFDWDVRQTASSSYGLLLGHISDFYDYCWDIEGLGHGTIYEIVIYIIFAIWNLPVFIAGFRPDGANMGVFVALWNKLLLVLCFWGSALVLQLISERMNLVKKNDKKAALIWSAMPLVFFLVLIQGSYDVLYVIFMLIGVYFWLDKSSTRSFVGFNLFFGIAICIKPFPLFYYLILLLIKEKKVFKIFANGLLAVTPYALCKLLYIHSEGYQAVLAFNTGNIYSVYANSFQYLVPFIVIYIWVCAKAFWSDHSFGEEDSHIEWLYLCNLASFSFIGFSTYHPQWIMGAVPFWVLSFLYNKKKVGYALASLVLTVAFYVLFGLQPGVHVDQGMLYILTDKGLGVVSSPVFSIDKFYRITDIRIPYSIVTGCMFVLAFFSQKKYCIDDRLKKDEDEKGLRSTLVAVSIIGVLAFVGPAILCWFPPKFLTRTVAGLESTPVTTTAFVDKTGYKECFYANEDCLTSELDLYVYTWNKAYSDDDAIYITLSDEQGRDLFSHTLSLAQITSEIVAIPMEIEMKNGNQYSLSFAGSSDDEENLAALGVVNIFDGNAFNLTRGDIQYRDQCITFSIKGKIK